MGLQRKQSDREQRATESKVWLGSQGSLPVRALAAEVVVKSLQCLGMIGRAGPEGIAIRQDWLLSSTQAQIPACNGT